MRRVQVYVRLALILQSGDDGTGERVMALVSGPVDVRNGLRIGSYRPLGRQGGKTYDWPYDMQRTMLCIGYDHEIRISECAERGRLIDGVEDQVRGQKGSGAAKFGGGTELQVRCDPTLRTPSPESNDFGVQV
jgi:hypothetical protein